MFCFLYNYVSGTSNYSTDTPTALFTDFVCNITETDKDYANQLRQISQIYSLVDKVGF